MDAKTIIQQALKAGVALYLRDGQLAYKAHKGGLPETLKTLIRSNKAGIERYLADAATVPQGIEAPPSITARHLKQAALSFSQERLWAIDRLAGGSPYYNLPFAIELKGECDCELMRRAIGEIVARHEILRTTYADDGDSVRQAVHEDYRVPFATFDLTALSTQRQHEEIERLIAAEADYRFDLSKDILLRCSLIRTASDTHILLANMHHIASDGWSIGILIREFSRLYEAYSLGRDNPLRPLSLQYSDYAQWQREHLTDAALDANSKYWLTALDGLPQSHNLRTDRPRPPTFSYRGALLESGLGRDRMGALQQLAMSANATLYIVMQAAMAVLLHRYSGERRIVIGSAVANREQPEIADLIGCFINMLVFDHSLSPQTSFAQVLRQVRERVLDGVSHQQFPFEMLVEKLQPARSLSHSPLFQIAMLYQNNANESLALPGLNARLLERHVGVVKYDLTLTIKETDSGLRLLWEYASDLFEAETIERMAASFDVLLSALTDPAHASTAIGQLPLLAEDEMGSYWQKCIDTAKLPPSQLPQLFEAQVRAGADKTAVVCAGESLSYGELNRRANRLAHWLTANGVESGALVGLCIERSVEMMVCLLGILKAGAAYLPMDPTYPMARLAHMLDDSGVRLLVTQSDLLPSLPPTQEQAQAFCLDAPDVRRMIESFPDTDPLARVEASGLAYVIYTSGSTGLPKGVAVEHGNVSNFLLSMQVEPGFSECDRLLAISPISFDIHVLELFLPLVSGGTVVVADKSTVGDGQRLLRMLVEERITLMQATPAGWYLMLATQQWEKSGELKILSGGEAMDRDLAGQLLQRGGSVWNLYGPTETTVYSSCARVWSDAEEITIGWPIANTGLYVLSEMGQPQPFGVIGEIHIGGAGVARGYLRREGLTAERFVADPFWQDGAPRMYKTGDFGYQRADGSLMYCGRADGQIKVRGFRIELEEVAHQLLKSARVAAATVVGDGEGDQRRLIAYVVPAQAYDPDLESFLREQLRRQLPEYMIPSAFVMLEQLPLTPNGKVDRKALEAPSPSALTASVPPETATEREVAAIWCEFLRLPEISMTSNFFEIGGHSLLGARMVTALNLKLGCDLRMKDVFEMKTARELALHIDFQTMLRRQETATESSGAVDNEIEAEW